MAIVKRFNPNHIYISKKMEDRLKTIYDYPVTILEAPTGYGKSTMVREYLKGAGRPFIWFNIDSENKEKFYNDFCLKVKGISEAASHALMSIGYPHDEGTIKEMVSIISAIPVIETTVFVLDNYHLVADRYLDNVIKDLAGVSNENIHIAILTQAVNSKGSFEMIMSKRINYLTKTDFEFDRNDIILYYKACGIKLNDSEADFLEKYTEGWISALYLQMLSLSSSNSFEMTADIENLMGKALWNNLDRVSRDFLVGISVFVSFTLRQCVFISGGMLDDDAIENLLNTSGFIYYEPKEGKYFMHSILKYFLDNKFKKMDVIFKKEILKKAGDWYRDNEMYADAISFYFKNKDYESILSMSYGADVLYEIHTERHNKAMFMDITTYTPASLKKKYLSQYILFVFFLFLDNEREYFERECEIIHGIIEKEYKNEDSFNELLGEYYVLEGFNHFNNLSEMNKNFVKAYGLLKKPSRVLASRISFMFSCPSPASLYHSIPGKIETEAERLGEIMPVYYKLTDGKSKGMEALFKAEMLLLQGELTDALKLCQKAIYMSTSREQADVHISALMGICRIAYLRGDTDMLQSNIEKMQKLAEEDESIENMFLCEMCTGFINMSINNIEKIPVWMTDSEKIEKKNIIMGLGFSNIVYGKYLIMKEEYTKFLSISGQMLCVAGIFNNIICNIYTLIYMSIAKNQTGDRKKAVKLLIEAVDLAKEDDIYIPFVENYNMLLSIMGNLDGGNEYTGFIKKVNEQSRKYIRGLQSAEKIAAKDHKFGLTKREMEVAKLAAKRMSNKEIAEQLFIAESTVKSNLKVIFNKLGINSRNELKNFF